MLQPMQEADALPQSHIQQHADLLYKALLPRVHR